MSTRTDATWVTIMWRDGRPVAATIASTLHEREQIPIDELGATLVHLAAKVGPAPLPSAKDGR